jgi:hypothetical protein
VLQLLLHTAQQGQGYTPPAPLADDGVYLIATGSDIWIALLNVSYRANNYTKFYAHIWCKLTYLTSKLLLKAGVISNKKDTSMAGAII